MSSEKKIELTLTTHEVLSVSTKHIPQDDTNHISQSMLSAIEYPEGWWICVPPFDEGDEEKLREQISSQLLAILKLAHNHNIGWVNLDADGQEYAWLAEFNW